MSDALKNANQKLVDIQLAQKHAENPTSASNSSVATSTASQQSDNVAHALAGAGGGLLSMAITYPLVTLSTRAQVESKKTHQSTLETIKAIIDREGVSGLFAGLDSALFGIGVTNFVYYYWYEWSRSFFERNALANGRPSKRLTTLESMAAGALAGSATVFCTNPIWVVNTRMTARKREEADTDVEKAGGERRVVKRPSTIGTLMKMLNEEGFSSLFAGVLPALVLVANPILQYTIFEQLKNMLERRRKTKAGPYDAFVLGAIGKLFATTIVSLHFFASTILRLTEYSRHTPTSQSSPALTFAVRLLDPKTTCSSRSSASSTTRAGVDCTVATCLRSHKVLSPQPYCSPSRTCYMTL